MEDKSFKQRLVYSSFIMPIRLALMFELPMTELVDLMQMATFHETKRRGLKMREVSELLDISMRKVSLMSQRLRRNFSEEDDLGLARRIEFMLWVEPLSEARILQVMRNDSVEEVKAALEQLLEDKRVLVCEEDGARIFQVSKQEYRLVSKEWSVRLDGVNNLLSNVANAIDARFFHTDDRAFARTVSFRIRDEDLPQLEQLYKELIWPRLKSLDEAAHEDLDAHVIDLSILWAPYEFILNHLKEKKGEQK